MGHYVKEEGLRPTKPQAVQSGFLSNSYYCLFIGFCICYIGFPESSLQKKHFACTVCTENSSAFPSAKVHRLFEQKPLAFHLLSSNAVITRYDFSAISEDIYSMGLIKTLTNPISPLKKLCF